METTRAIMNAIMNMYAAEYVGYRTPIEAFAATLGVALGK
jgi:hypothetical protein